MDKEPIALQPHHNVDKTTTTPEDGFDDSEAGSVTKSCGENLAEDEDVSASRESHLLARRRQLQNSVTGLYMFDKLNLTCERHHDDGPSHRRTGWALCSTPTNLVVHKRWVVLQDRKMIWQTSYDALRCTAVVDFDLVKCTVRRDWVATGEDGIDLWGSLMRSSCCARIRGNKFRISLMLTDLPGTCFELHFEHEGQADSWARDIETMISNSTLERSPDLAFLNLSIPKWWKVPRISPVELEAMAQSCDILLFRCPGAFPRVIRSVSRCRFDHVGILLKLADGKLALLEAVGSEGVIVTSWDAFIAFQLENLYPEIAFRKVTCTRTPETLQAFQNWVSSVIGKPYSLSSVGKRKSLDGHQDAFFCSCLVAEGLKTIGALPRGTLASEQFWPGSFSIETSHRFEWCEGCGFDGEERTIDFALRGPEELARVRHISEKLEA